jgi:putative DNA primase/helicase
MTDAVGMFDALPVGRLNGQHWPTASPSMELVAPVPLDAPEPPPLKGSQRWWYRDRSGRRLYAVDRYEWQKGDDRKSFVPWTLWQERDGTLAWHKRHPPEPRRLYGLDTLGQRPAATVLVVEGEKTADAAAAVLPDYVAVTSPGGSNAARAANWSALKERHVVIWGDNDEPGRKYAQEVADLAFAVGAASVRIVAMPREWPGGWDLADVLPEGVTVERLREMAADAVGRSADEEPIDLKEAGLTQRDALLQVCDDVTVWRSPDGDAYASMSMDGHVEHHAITSRAFKHWMLHGLARRFRQAGRPASANENAVRDARASVEARALLEGSMHPAVLRVAEHDGAIYIDHGAPDWSVIRVTVDGWSHHPCAPIPILRSRRTAAFAAPSGKEFAPLRRLLGHLEDDTYILFVAWCLGALLPNGPYPVLVLGGEQGSGKSTVARLAQRITDPVHGDLLQPPGTDRDLIAAARANRVMSFDNLSGITAELADSLCRLATGSELGGRALYTDHDTAYFSACRPLIINGIPDLAARGDLADRAIVLRLPTLPGRMTEKDWTAAVEAVLPPTFAALLNALSLGLRNLVATATPDVRMADFARFVVAAEPALPWPFGAFIDALERSRIDARAALVDGDAVATAVRVLMEDRRTVWEGLVSELYRELSARVAATGHRVPDWPGNPRWFGDRLRRAAPALRALGIDPQEHRTAQGMRVKISRIATSATSATRPAPNDDVPCAAGVASVATGPTSGSAHSAHNADRAPHPLEPDNTDTQWRGRL